MKRYGLDFGLGKGDVFMRLIRCFVCIMAAFLLFSVPISAGDSVYIQGEVIYHQDFSVLSDFNLSGIQKGTAGSPNSSFSCNDGVLRIETHDDGRVYAILPSSDWTKNFTIEFEFSFRNSTNPNGYLAVMLTSSGEEPTNISQITIRAKGKIDDFDPLSKEMAEHIQNGGAVTVAIPVKDGVVESLLLSANGITEELHRTSLLLIGSGNRGFTVRNADVDISEIFIVNGTDYSNKTGHYAEKSYASDAPVSDDPITAPETGDSLPVAAFAAMAAVSLAAIIKFKKKDNFISFSQEQPSANE